MECLAHGIYGAWKAGVVDVQSEDGLTNTSITKAKMNKDITWKKKSQKDAVDLIQAQKNCKFANVRLLAPDKIGFAYILHYLKTLPTNKDTI